MAWSRPAALEKRLGHRFAAAGLLQQALTHRSYGPENNERLEFLGDGVLGCAVADELYARFPQLHEGKLTQLRASLVRKEALAEVGERLRLTEFLRIELQPNARITASIFADTVEALFGAIFLDGGYVAARMSVVRAFAPLFARLDAHMPKDAKTRLQEIMQARKQKLPEYRVVGEHGQAHARTFEVECVVGLGLRAKGSGSSRRSAEQQAAMMMLEQLSK